MKAKTYYFYVVVEFGAIPYNKTYVIGKGQYKQPQRTKLFKTMSQWFDDTDSSVVGYGYTDDADDVRLQPHTPPSHDFIADLTTT